MVANHVNDKMNYTKLILNKNVQIGAEVVVPKRSRTLSSSGLRVADFLPPPPPPPPPPLSLPPLFRLLLSAVVVSMVVEAGVVETSSARASASICWNVLCLMAM